MRKILLENPGIATFNLGDQIISDSAKNELNSLFANDFIVEVSTHLPLNFYFGRRFKNFDHKIVLGSNIMNPNPTYGYRKQWAISPRTFKYWGPAVLCGVGWSAYREKTAWGQRYSWKKVLHPTMLHSVRDSYTLEKMQSLGFTNVINTGCPTTWCLTPEHMAKVETEPQKRVVFTLTDYAQDKENDRSMVQQLLDFYEEVWFWPQGIKDKAYIQTLLSTDELARIKWVQSSLSAYDQLLETADGIDYVGTRLHGGIRALQKLRRTLIISVDNRAREKQKDNHMTILERTDIGRLTGIIEREIKQEIVIKQDAIRRWKQQFTENL